MTPSAPDVLVVGGTGFLGRHLIALADGALAATHRRTDAPDESSDWHRCDLGDGGAEVGELIRSLRPRSVINATYVQGGDDLDAVTARAPGEMATACREVGARFVHVSTDVVFDGTTDRPYRESDPPSPVHDYGRAKAESERRVAAANPGAVIARTSLLWGGRDDPGPQALLTTDPAVTFFDDEYRNPLRVADLARACLELTGRADIRGLLHLAGADTVDRFTFARAVAPLVDVDPTSLRGGPSPVGSTRPRNCALDSSLARSLLRTELPGLTESAP